MMTVMTTVVIVNISSIHAFVFVFRRPVLLIRISQWHGVATDRLRSLEAIA
jgi:hypothetical protein